MSIDLSKVTAISDAKGAWAQVADASGRVIWAAKTAGSVRLNPFADLGLAHAVQPYGLFSKGCDYINEEVADGDATYIYTQGSRKISLFDLENKELPAGAIVTAVEIVAVPWSGSSTATQSLAVDVVGTASASVNLTSGKDFNGSLPDLVAPINEYLATNKMLPSMHLSIDSTVSSMAKSGEPVDTGITQAYVVISYE